MYRYPQPGAGCTVYHIALRSLGGRRSVTIGGRLLLEGLSVTTIDEAKQMAKLLGKHFIARPDVKAIQNSQGEYRPLRDDPFTMPDLTDHILGHKTYGHYMLGADDSCKLFCFDIDLLPQDKKQEGKVYHQRRLPVMKNRRGGYFGWEDGNPREHWGSRKAGPARDFLKIQMLVIAGILATRISQELEIPTLATYSGSKGVHVYGFTGKTTAALARQGAQLVLDSLRETRDVTGSWELSRGNNFYSYQIPGEENGKAHQINPQLNWEQFSLEVYPKQESLSGKDLGNLLRLPLGVNLKSPHRDPGFFINLGKDNQDPRNFKPMNPITALTTMNPWQ